MTAHLSGEALSVWEDVAAFWDENYTRDGNQYFKVLQAPAIERFIAEKVSGGAHVKALDLATGNGVVARLIARHPGTTVLATDGADNMLRIAQGHVEDGMNMRFRKVDVTSDHDLAALIADEGEKTFDIVTISMAIMDIATLDPLVRALPKLLAKDGIFVATVLHPVFFTNNATRKIEIDFDPEGNTRVVRSKVIKEYLHVPPFRGWAIPGQPRMQLYFHRPMCELFSTFFKGGLVMDAMEEPAFTEADAREDRREASVNYTQLPAILAWRMRLAA
ncbi:S-adenosyl-L-methionine-dependent methyltransferase [Echria macrotheca]|uniref:S-adenosyl-L-methionine-dependent methyltransferase n=1 Tax=Echria macrotheca TaxID=438768 RepID=A0AAJ0F563_9PEZI|nr:S-adenosyl-L-methionine-dependent methyltransferase [Echria macrotheca]